MENSALARLETYSQALLHTVIDGAIESNASMVGGRFKGPEGIYQRLFALAGFSAYQLKAVEYLLNNVADQTIALLLDEIDRQLAEAELRIEIAPESEDSVDISQRSTTSLVDFYAGERWRDKHTRFQIRQRELASELSLINMQE